VHDTPSLRGGDHAAHEDLEGVLARALAARLGRDPDDLEIRVVAVAAIGVLRLASEAWLNSSTDDEGPEVHGKAAFVALRRAATG